MKILGFTGPNVAAVDGVVSAVADDIAGGYRFSFQRPLINALLKSADDVVLAAEALFGLSSVLRSSGGMKCLLDEWGGRSAYDLVCELRQLLETEFGENWRADVVSHLTPLSLLDPATMKAPITPTGATGQMILMTFKAAVLREFGDDLLIKRADHALQYALECERSLQPGESPAVAILFDDVVRPSEAKWLQDQGAALIYVASDAKDDRVSLTRTHCQDMVWNNNGSDPDPVHTLSPLKGWLRSARDIGPVRPKAVA